MKTFFQYFFLILLALCTGLHLWASWVDNQKKRNITKPPLLMLILSYYLLTASPVSRLLVWALFTSWLGDVLLMGKGNKWFTLGGISFMLTHFLFIAVYATGVDFKKVNLFAVVPAALVYYGISAVIIYTLKPSTPKKMLIPMYIYLLCNSTMNVFSLMQLLAKPGFATAIAYIGAVLFFVSDCTLFLVRYHKNRNLIFKRHFTVMLTYVLGEFMITQGMLMLSR